jgi:hypothetical protein
VALMPTNILPTQVYPFGPTGGKTGLRHLLMMLCAMQEGVAPFGGGGDALLLGDDTARQGIYEQTNDAVVTVALPAASAAQPRFDQLVLHVYDSSITGGSDTPQLEVLQGTAQAGVTIDNRLGVASLPNNAIRLAEWVTPASAGAYVITNALIRDRRPWARGARYQSRLVASGVTAAASPGVAIDSANGKRRLECSGAPLIALIQTVLRHTTAGSDAGLAVMIDGALSDNMQATMQAAAPNFPVAFIVGYNGINGIPLAAGSHLFDWNVYSAPGTASASTPSAGRVQVYEDLRQQAQNGTT